MKTKLLFLGMLFSLNVTFGQNQSSGSVDSPILPAGSPTNTAPTSEIFRFKSGAITQLDAGTIFDFTSTRWLAMGRVPTGTQTFYGQRFQLPNAALVMGYSINNVTTLPSNPFIQWIGTGANLGNLEFRVANSFGSNNNPGNDLLVATMTNTGNTFFGTDQTVTGASAKVNIRHSNAIGLNIENKFIQNSPVGAGLKIAAASGTNTNIGADVLTEGGNLAFGVRSVASGANNFSSTYGVYGETMGTTFFEAAIYGKTPGSFFGNKFAGFFDGATFSTTGWGPSDAKLKDNVKVETNVLERLSKLRAVSYDYKKITELNLPLEAQHGFVAQELEAVFPELTKDISKPIFDKEGKIVSQFEFKSVNYTGLISLLTAGINELNEELQSLKQELADLKSNTSEAKIGGTNNTKGLVLEQNIPNPFSDRTSIKYQLPAGTTTASLIVFDLNGRIIKEFQLTKNANEITINAADVGKGLFIYSLVQNGQELLSKKMIIK
jgi:hypothetical protein